MRFELAAAVLFAIAACSAADRPATARAPAPAYIDLPGGAGGIGFDDLQFSPRLGRVLAPAGRAGILALVDPVSRGVRAIGGFSAAKRYDGGHDFGITSVADTGAALAVTDRTARALLLVDPDRGEVTARAALASTPDYVRWVAATHELWVTEPDAAQIEVFAARGLERRASIRVPGGPESLAIDAVHGRAYTHLWKGATVSIDVRSREVGRSIANGCEGSRGLAIDELHDLVFAGCADGTVDVLAAEHVIDSLTPVRGMDLIAWSPSRRHLYLAGSRSGDVAIVAVSDRGTLSLLGRAPGAVGGHCVTTDDAGHAYVCDPDAGRLIAVDDAF
ncbi:MAG: hypothetical protein E6J87_16340 [Deltaproteobacteria bacterium]|nr:MAG: hypothetical protein E6J87_16340 [Deltaproteobacteria bacterium]